jgi:hypothetical protein
MAGTVPTVFPALIAGKRERLQAFRGVNLLSNFLLACSLFVYQHFDARKYIRRRRRHLLFALPSHPSSRCSRKNLRRRQSRSAYTVRKMF